MGANPDMKTDSAAAYVVDDAVGVAESHWFVALVNHNSEKQSSERLTKLGVANFVPTQTEIRVWKNGRKSKVSRVVIPSVIFIHCTEEKRKDIVGLPFILRFMTNKAGTSSNGISKPLAIIPNDQMERLKFMLGQSDVPVRIGELPLERGDKVRVMRGNLAGLEGEVIDMNDSKSELIVAINIFGCARLSIETINLKRI